MPHEVAPPRSTARRRQDTLDRLEHDVDAWVASAGDDEPYLVPLSFHWDGSTLLLGRELMRDGRWL